MNGLTNPTATRPDNHAVKAIAPVLQPQVNTYRHIFNRTVASPKSLAPFMLTQPRKNLHEVAWLVPVIEL